MNSTNAKSQRRPRIGIKIKMTLAFGAVFILLALLFNYNSYLRIRTLLIEDNDQYLLARANSLLQKTEISPTIIPLPDKGQFIKVFFHTNGNEHLVFVSPGLTKNLKTPSFPGVSDTLDLRVAYVRNSSNNEDNPAELLLVTSAAPLRERIRSLIDLLFVSSLFSVLIAGCISYLLAGVLLHPLQRIIDTAGSIRYDRLDEVMPVRKTNDELQDLTETLNAMLGRIRNASRQQQHFFASASHELKTPLAILRAELELGLGQPEIRNDVKNLLDSQLSEVRRLQEIVEDFLLISQLKEGSLRIRKAPFDLSATIMRTFKRLNPFLTAIPVTPSIEFDQEACSFIIKGDEEKIAMVLFNLVENAVKYAVPGSTLRCRVFTIDNRLMVMEMENAINEERIEVARLPDAFFQGDHLHNGAGLGLWLCSEIMRLHGGRLKLESEGFRFLAKVEFPLDSEK